MQVGDGVGWASAPPGAAGVRARSSAPGGRPAPADRRGGLSVASDGAVSSGSGRRWARPGRRRRGSAHRRGSPRVRTGEASVLAPVVAAVREPTGPGSRGSSADSSSDGAPDGSDGDSRTKSAAVSSRPGSMASSARLSAPAARSSPRAPSRTVRPRRRWPPRARRREPGRASGPAPGAAAGIPPGVEPGITSGATPGVARAGGRGRPVRRVAHARCGAGRRGSGIGAQGLGGRTAPGAGQSSVEMPSARVAVIHGARRLGARGTTREAARVRIL